MPKLRTCSASNSQTYSSLESIHFDDDTSTATSMKINRLWLRRIWIIHLLISISVMTLGIMDNKTSKYVPIGPEKAGDNCERAFLNVLATSNQVEGAITCCIGENSVTSLCPGNSRFLPLANRLARWPDAWILPLFPLFLRLVYVSALQICYFCRGADMYHASTTPQSSLMASLRRLGYYIILLNFRGWVLYVGLNAIEDMVVRPVDTSTCWYHDWLQNEQPPCFGRVFDFSDHIVLYYAQILPMSIFEFLHSMEYPYWKSSSTNVGQAPPVKCRATCIVTIERLVPFSLVSGMIYLYVITCLGVYKTALYFHTGLEVVVGFFVSQLVHMPLCYIQCAEIMEPMRDFLFATSSSPVTKYKSLS
ncbi:hypothetical protein MPSEU_000500100 [Mayamaea pseudoterrestris]|nr:hypothetical protein MPSEU_000500100 [Mayamaea pseudoterrestris]